MARMRSVFGTGIVAATAAAATAQTPPSYDFDFATIGAMGNAPYPGGPGPFLPMAGRGGVAYEYRISRLEISTGQWMEFINNYAVLGGTWTTFGMPAYWGADLDPNYTGPGFRYALDPAIPNAARVPVGGVSWREAAMYCNWLHNGKDPTVAALQNGAYDASTFGSGGGITFTDQWHHNPDAKYWIPTLDEWLKAAHYDPNRYGVGQGGWWEYSYGSDTPPTPGLPGEGQTSAGENIPDFWQIPLGAYAEMQSPWGLWDTSGGVAELTEEVVTPWMPYGRLLKGSAYGEEYLLAEIIWDDDRSATPWAGGVSNGLRVASSIPAPATCGALIMMIAVHIRRRRL